MSLSSAMGVVYFVPHQHANPMAKAPAKSTTKSAAKSATPKATAKTEKKKSVAAPSLEDVSEAALAKLKALDLDAQLQADMEWCLGSYRSDRNPVGLIETCERALQIFKAQLAQKKKGVTKTLVTSLEAVVAAR